MEVLLNCLTQLTIRMVKFAEDDFFFFLPYFYFFNLLEETLKESLLAKLDLYERLAGRLEVLWKTPKLTLRVTLWHLGLCATSDSSRSNSFTTVLQLFYHNSESLKKL